MVNGTGVISYLPSVGCSFSDILVLIGVFFGAITLLYSRAGFQLSKKRYIEEDKRRDIEEKQRNEVTFDDPRTVPSDILSHINISSSMKKVEDYLGHPHRRYCSTSGIFSEPKETNSFLYEFKNCSILIESDDGDKIDMIAIDHLTGESKIEIPDTDLVLGESKLGGDFRGYPADKIGAFRTSKLAYVAVELGFGNLGAYKLYTIGSYVTSGKEFRDGILYGVDDEIIPLDDVYVDFVAISYLTGRGANIDYQLFR